MNKFVSLRLWFSIPLSIYILFNCGILNAEFFLVARSCEETKTIKSIDDKNAINWQPNSIGSKNKNQNQYTFYILGDTSNRLIVILFFLRLMCRCLFARASALKTLVKLINTWIVGNTIINYFTTVKPEMGKM